MPDRASPTVAVVGAGVAGLAAATALSSAGYSVHVLERRPYVGGRASSYLHPALNEVIDSQHVLVGCCTNLIDLLERSGVARQIRWYDELTFLEPNGHASTFRPGPLPAPLHYTGSFLRAPMLSLADKLGIARGMATLLAGIPPDDSEGLEAWLARTGQTERARRHFWEPIVVCTLNDGFHNCSARHAAHVFRDLFLLNPVSGRLGIPAIPLSDLYSAAARLIEDNGGTVHLRSSVEAIEQLENGRWRLTGNTLPCVADTVILAVPFEQMQRLLPTLSQSPAAGHFGANLAHFIHSPYTTVHLWFDREITRLPHAALLDSDLQWIFNKSRIREDTSGPGCYVELVVAASQRYLAMPRAEVLRRSLENLMLYFPEAKNAQLLRSAVLKEARATFSVVPGLDLSRPNPVSPWPRIFLAGDWTATGWPATMESAARSGYLAAAALAASFGQNCGFLVPDLAPTGLMRWFSS
jgi:squalene-associated FAD-dependent desaturase